MKNKINLIFRLIFMVLLLTFFEANAQIEFSRPLEGVDLTCNIDVNHQLVPNFREDLKRATFKYFPDGVGSCTGTLVNRNVVTGQLGNYFITAWHCFKSGDICDGVELNYNNLDYNFVFNWQSPNNQLG